MAVNKARVAFIHFASVITDESLSYACTRIHEPCGFAEKIAMRVAVRRALARDVRRFASDDAVRLRGGWYTLHCLDRALGTMDRTDEAES